jgi:hypothetical protein
MSEQSHPHRWRRVAAFLRFRLSTLLLLTALIATLLSWRRERQSLLGEIERLRNPNPGWGVREATGPPDTSSFGDIPTAWASKTQNGQVEWLQLEFAAEINPQAVHIHETHCPGAVTKITRVNILGNEETLWQGTDPTPISAPGGVSKIVVNGRKPTSRIKIYLDSAAVPGWNEIDAVGLIDAQGQPHWATKASASSSYGPNVSSSDPVIF